MPRPRRRNAFAGSQFCSLKAMKVRRGRDDGLVNLRELLLPGTLRAMRLSLMRSQQGERNTRRSHLVLRSRPQRPPISRWKLKQMAKSEVPTSRRSSPNRFLQNCLRMGQRKRWGTARRSPTRPAFRNIRGDPFALIYDIRGKWKGENHRSDQIFRIEPDIYRLSTNKILSKRPASFRRSCVLSCRRILSRSRSIHRATAIFSTINSPKWGISSRFSTIQHTNPLVTNALEIERFSPS